MNGVAELVVQVTDFLEDGFDLHFPFHEGIGILGKVQVQRYAKLVELKREL